MSTPASQLRPLSALWRAICFVSLPLGILNFLLPVYGKELGASALEVGTFFAAISFVPVVVRPFLGWILDRWGRRPFLLLGLAGYTAAIVLFSLARSVPLLAAASFVYGLGPAFLWISALTIVADVAAEAGRGRDFGRVAEASGRGGIVGNVIGFSLLFLLTKAGLELTQVWSWLLIGYSVPAAVAFWYGWRGVPETRPPVTTAPAKRRAITAQLLVLMGIVCITAASSALIWPLLIVYLQLALQVDVLMLSLTFIPNTLIGALLPSHMGRIADRTGRKALMIAGLVVSALASALVPHLRGMLPLALLWAVQAVGVATTTPAEHAFVADIAGRNVRGTNYGLYSFAYYLGASLGPLAGGWMYDNLSQATPFYLNAAVLLLGAVLVATLLREPHIGIQKVVP